MKKYKIVLAVLFGLLIVAAAVYAGLRFKNILGDSDSQSSSQSSSISSSTSSQSASSQQSQSESEGESTDTSEIRGVWVATTMNLDFPSQPDLTVEQLKAELDAIVDNAKAWGLNAIFFQVRPSSDALYDSDIFPVSKFLSSTNELPDGFDPLEYIIERAHEEGLQLHAWINPLRVTTGSADDPEHDLSALPAGHPALDNMYSTVAFADGKLYFDPGYPQVRQLIIDGVMEIVNHYDVDGIHFDDYFYPYPVSGAEFDDSASYAAYGEGKSLDDFRRDNITSLIESVYSAIKAADDDVVFGVSPFAVWQNSDSDVRGSETNAGIQSYSDLYADTLSWVKSGILDYICPQIYWSMTQTGVNFDVVFDWWKNCVKGTDVDLLVGHALYKTGYETDNWDDGLEIARQLDYSMSSGVYGGSIFFRYKIMLENPLGVTESVKAIFERYPIGSVYLATTNEYAQPNWIGADNSGSIVFGSDGTGYTTDSSRGGIIGAANPSLPLYCNGEQIEMTEKGFFSVYKELAVGTNIFTFSQGDCVVDYYITRDSGQENADIFADVWPQKNYTCKQGNSITLSIYTSRECTVVAHFREAELTLTAEKKGSGYLHTGVLDEPPLGSGTVEYELNYPDEYGVAKSEGIVTVLSPNEPIYIEVIKDCSVIKHTNTSNVARWNVPVITGTILEAVGLENDYYVLKDFGYILAECAQSTNTAPGESMIFTAGMTEKDEKQCFSITKTGSIAVDIKAYKNAIRVIAYGKQLNIISPLSFKTLTEYDNITATVYKDRVEYLIFFDSQEAFLGFSLQKSDSGIDIVFKDAPVVVSETQPLTGMKIALNMGHGPRSGAPGPMGYQGWVEDEFNSDIVERTRDYLVSLGAEADLVSTMDDPVDIDEVVEAYESGGYDLAVSVHFNSVAASSNPASPSGTYAYYAYPNSQLLAKCLIDSICDASGLKSNGVVRDSFRVTRTYTCPSVLMEMAFMCNPQDYDWMCEDYNRQALAKGLALGILEYLTQ